MTEAQQADGPETGEGNHAEPVAAESPHLLPRTVPWWAVVLVAAVVYANTLWNGFAYDDPHIILDNARVHQLADQGAIWLTPYWPSLGPELGLWRPVAIFGYALQWAVSGGAPWFFHLVNVLLHAGVTVLGLLLLRRWASPLAAGFGALVFAVHPVHVEAVANVVGQAELLSAGAVLAALLVHLGRPGLEVGWGRRLALLGLYAVGLLSKESAVTLPALLVLVDIVDGRVRRDRAGLAAYARAMAVPLILLAALVGYYLVARYQVLGNLTGVDAAPALPYLRETGPRLMTAFRAWPEFVRLLFLPADLIVDYAPAVVLPVRSFTPMAGLGAVLLGLAVLLALLTPWAPRAGLPAAWFLLTILTVSNLFFPVGVLLAERTLYLPLLALSFMVAFTWDAVEAGRIRVPRQWAAAVLLVALALLSLRTVRRNPVWRSTSDVVDSLVQEHPESYKAQWMLGWELERMGRIAEAEQRFRLALALWPEDSQFLADYGLFHIRQRNFDEAIDLLLRSSDRHPFVGRTWTLLAFAYVGAERWEEALVAQDRAHRFAGTDDLTWYAMRARVYEGLDRWEDAVAGWRVVGGLPGGDRWLFSAFQARALARVGMVEEAAALVAELLEGEEDASIRTNLTGLAAAIRDGCYGAPGAPDRPPEGCVDPLGGWTMAGETVVLNPARGLQNATS